jgi:peptidoglycan hydrolase CwlO-like protein
MPEMRIKKSRCPYYMGSSQGYIWTSRQQAEIDKANDLIRQQIDELAEALNERDRLQAEIDRLKAELAELKSRCGIYADCDECHEERMKYYANDKELEGKEKDDTKGY